MSDYTLFNPKNMLHVDEIDMLEFFEREPETIDDGISLTLTVWPYDQEALISLRQASNDNELLNFYISGAVRVQAYNNEKRPFVEIEYPAGSTNNGTKSIRVARIFTTPEFHVAISEG